jgi:hypothetical protein
MMIAERRETQSKNVKKKIFFLFFHYVFDRLRKEKLEENLENEKLRRSSENGTPNNDSPILNLSKHRDRSTSPEYHQNASSPGVESVENLDANDASDDMEVSENSPHSRSQTPTQLGSLNNKINYHSRDFSRPTPSIAFPSTEILLRNIQELIKVVLENSIQQEQQLSFEKGTNCENIEIAFQKSPGSITR